MSLIATLTTAKMLARHAPRRMGGAPALRFLSTDDGGSHPDFMPQRNAEVSDDTSAHAFIKQAIADNKVMLFMKGTPEAPRCGFSQQVVRILHAEGVPFSSANVLESEEIREGVKQVNNWPTVPQLCIDGEFIGGCDIVTQMYQEGELRDAFIEAGVKEKE